MRKAPLIIAAGVLAALVVGDVLEIRFHTEKLAGLPSAISATVSDGSMYEKARAQVVTIRRSADRFLVKEKRQQYEVALNYVTEDSERLKKLTESGEDPEKITVQATLLEQSLDRLRQQANNVSVDDIASLKEKTSTALNTAQSTLETVKEVAAGYDTLKSHFTEAKEFIEKQIGQLTTPDDSGAVAGTVDEAEKSDNTSNQENTPVPLKF